MALWDILHKFNQILSFSYQLLSQINHYLFYYQAITYDYESCLSLFHPSNILTSEDKNVQEWLGLIFRDSPSP